MFLSSIDLVRQPTSLGARGGRRRLRPRTFREPRYTTSIALTTTRHPRANPESGGRPGRLPSQSTQLASRRGCGRRRLSWQAESQSPASGRRAGSCGSCATGVAQRIRRFVLHRRGGVRRHRVFTTTRRYGYSRGWRSAQRGPHCSVRLPGSHARMVVCAVRTWVGSCNKVWWVGSGLARPEDASSAGGACRLSVSLARPRVRFRSSPLPGLGPGGMCGRCFRRSRRHIADRACASCRDWRIALASGGTCSAPQSRLLELAFRSHRRRDPQLRWRRSDDPIALLFPRSNHPRVGCPRGGKTWRAGERCRHKPPWTP